MCKKFNLVLIFLSYFTSVAAFAICPICTIAVGAGIGLSEWVGIDDSITGLWIGGLIISMIGWTISWLDKQQIQFKGRKILVTVGYYVLIIAPLYYQKIIGHPLNKLWGIDKLVLGITIGSLAFAIGAISYFYLKKRHGNKAYFPFQKVFMPIVPLVILSAVFYFITK